ncbi:MAG: hypothetical protein ABFD49_08035 [Armatimonadota bacterium]|nr:hypothetical protein [bacterium]
MPKREGSVETVREICIDPQPSGLRAVYLVETRSEEESREIDKLFLELESQIQVRQLCRGKLVSYVVQAHESDASVLDEIEDILKKSYAFVVTQRSFDDLICRIVRELCEDTGSKLSAIPKCNICGKVEPFPNTVVNLSDDDGSVLISRNYCSSCTAEASAPSNKEFIKSLLAADKRDFRKIESAELVRHPSRKQSIRFRVKDFTS